MKVLREVKYEMRPGRGRWWWANSKGYTDRVDWAGIYEAEGDEDRNKYIEVEALPVITTALDEANGVVKRLGEMVYET